MRDAAALRKQIQARLARQRALVQELLEARAQVRGSVFARYAACGKHPCTCRSGRGHGPYYVLSARRRGAGSFVYLSAAQAREARGLVGASRRYRKGLAELQELNDELVGLLRRYQAALVRAGGRKLGIRAA